jgi:hypothetical protein
MVTDVEPMQEPGTVRTPRRGSDVIKVEYVTAWRLPALRNGRSFRPV